MLEIKTNTNTMENAKLLAKIIVNGELAAAVNIIPIESVYFYQGKMHQSSEFTLIIKSSEALFTKIEELIKEHHSYALPAIYAVTMSYISAEYNDWLDSVGAKS